MKQDIYTSLNEELKPLKQNRTHSLHKPQYSNDHKLSVSPSTCSLEGTELQQDSLACSESDPADNRAVHSSKKTMELENVIEQLLHDREQLLEQLKELDYYRHNNQELRKKLREAAHSVQEGRPSTSKPYEARTSETLNFTANPISV
jgi:hypothetical protein